MRAERRSKTVAFVAILALTTSGALVLGANLGQSVNNLAVIYAQEKYSRTATAAVIAHQTAAGKADKWTGTPRTATAIHLSVVKPSKRIPPDLRPLLGPPIYQPIESRLGPAVVGPSNCGREGWQMDGYSADGNRGRCG